MKNNYYFTDVKSEIEITKLVTIHYFEFNRNFVYHGESHDFWELVYVDSGSLEVKYGNGTFILRQGDLMLFEPNVYHKTRSYNAAPDVLNISFSCQSKPLYDICGKAIKVGRREKQFFGEIINEALNAFVLEKNNPEMSGLVVRKNAPFGGADLIKLYLQIIMTYLIRGAKTEKPSRADKSTSDNPIAYEVTSYISEHCEERLSVKDICNYFGYSVTYLENVITDVIHMSIGEYYNKVRIDRAKKYIKEGKLNFSQISEKLKFNNPRYFCRVFRRVTRLSPTEYKRSLQVK